MEKIPVRHIAATKKEPACSENFSIRDLQTLLDGKDMVQELHRHDFFYVLALKKAKGKHEIDFASCLVCDHSIFFMRPGQVHQLILKAGSTGWLMQFRTDFYFPSDKISNRLLRNAAKTNLYKLTGESFQKLAGILKYILQEYIDKQNGHQEIIRANMGIFFIELARQYKGETMTGSPSVYIQERLEEFLNLLEIHVVTHKQVSEYAAMMNLSVFQLNAITRASIGKTCSALITEQILLEAKRWLLATSNQINQVADQLGYDDSSYFIRFFKKHTGYSPESFRHKFM